MHVVRIVRIVFRMRQNEFGSDLAHGVHEVMLGLAIELQRIVAQIEETDVVDGKRACSPFGLHPPYGLYLVQGHATLFPKLGTFAALAVRKANDRNLPPNAPVKGNRPSASPDEIGGVRGYDQCRPVFIHARSRFPETMPPPRTAGENSRRSPRRGNLYNGLKSRHRSVRKFVALSREDQIMLIIAMTVGRVNSLVVGSSLSAQLNFLFAGSKETAHSVNRMKTESTAASTRYSGLPGPLNNPALGDFRAG